MMYDQKRLHPVAVLVKIAKAIKEIIVTNIFLFVTNIGNIRSFLLIGTILALILTIISSVLNWLKFTYRIEENEFRVEQGVFLKKNRYIPIERIQSINVTAGFIQRLFGVVKLEIETAGGMGEAEVELSAIRKEEAEQIRTIIKEQKRQIAQGEAEQDKLEEGRVLYKISFNELLITAATSSGLGVALSIVAFLSQFDEIIPYEKIFDKLEWIVHASVTMIVILCLIGLIIAWIISFIGVLLQYGDFTVREEAGQIIISSGIFEKKQISIPIDRIQAIKVTENWLRQPFGYATVHIESAGGGSDKDVETILFPLIRKKQVKEKVESFFHLTIIETLHPVPRRALSRFLLRMLILSLLIAVPLCLFFKPWGYLSLILIPFALVLGYFQYKDTGWYLNGKELTLSFRVLNKTTVFFEKKRIQSLELKQSYFQRQKDLTSVQCSIISKSTGSFFAVKNLEEKDGMEIYKWFSRRSEGQV
ncbi:MAG: hypothetical protein C6W58_11105 [Bacillaceae bacterium]|nr:MAG: hypothetical protein C6W58_11105 [Bacillaceae bacterium]